MPRGSDMETKPRHAAESWVFRLGMSLGTEGDVAGVKLDEEVREATRLASSRPVWETGLKADSSMFDTVWDN